jgi:hypothetical protein
MQTKDNGDGTYSLRYVYGVSGLSDLDVAIGFDVTVQIEGQEAREVTVYCPTLYKSIKAGEKTHTNTDEGVDYLFTLEIANVPATVLDFDETKVYLKNGQLSIQPFTCAEKVWNENELRFKREDLVTTIAK